MMVKVKKKLKCQVCGMKFTSHSKFRMHKLNCTPKEKKEQQAMSYDSNGIQLTSTEKIQANIKYGETSEGVRVKMKDTKELELKWNSHRDMVEKILVNEREYKCSCGKRAVYLQARDPVDFELVCMGCAIFGIKFKLPIVDKKTMEKLRIVQLQFDRHIYT